MPRIPIVRSKSGQPQGSSLTGPAPSVDAAPVGLQGRPQEGAWLRASVASAGLSPLPDVAAYPRYHKPPGRRRWELTPGASGPTYQVQRGDMAYAVMVLIALPSPNGSRRIMSNPVGLILASGARAP